MQFDILSLQAVRQTHLTQRVSIFQEIREKSDRRNDNGEMESLPQKWNAFPEEGASSNRETSKAKL